ncbi:MAG: alpha/beta hydrolase [Ignavibacteriales bacterium]|nr:alpha/beta hydrolase [Ignavibacteriales bacterium]
MKNFDKPEILSKSDGYFFGVRDGHHLFIYNYTPVENYNSTIFIISGITGINHHNEKDLISILSNDENRVVVIYPRGTGYSEGMRGDISNFEDFINDFSEIISNDKDYNSEHHKIFLYGHSMSCAILLAVTYNLKNIAGAILVNPPYMQKAAKGMSPSFCQYIKYGCYYLFARHTPIVNMAGDPNMIENEEDRKESESRINDSSLVKYFSMYMMIESKKIMDSMIEYSKTANYPLLLIYGEKDNIVDKTGCDLIFKNWKHQNKQYILIENGSHGKSTVTQANEIIRKWISNK